MLCRRRAVKVLLVVFVIFVACTEQKSLKGKDKKKKKLLMPWQINQGICPPSLCPPQPMAQGTGPQPAASPVAFQFFEGDIVLGGRLLKKMKSKKEGTRKRHRRAAVRGGPLLWKNGIVPFEVDTSLSNKVKRQIGRAHKHISQKTCIKFKPRTEDDKDYISYVYEPGCWSYIGVQSGPQRVALGYGCDKLGTVIHETAHALGFWHEQSRRDRDKYVTILEENISPSAKSNFEKLTKKVQNSRGYPYDYRSIMHYAADYFSINGKPTIKVIGVGKQLGLKIGQRFSLSALDIAQLNDMYQCNKPITGCPDGWVRDAESCYKFVQKPKQFAGAQKECDEDNAWLVNIGDSKEEQFLSKYLKENFAKVKTWRTGGKKYDSRRWIWHRQDARHSQRMTYHRFGGGQPGKYTTLVLEADGRGGYRWKGAWAGSVKDLPKYAHPFICEQKSNKTCTSVRYADGRDYRGKLDFTVSGVTCQRWDAQYPHRHKAYSPRNITNQINGLLENNYCRNPSTARRERPWCYTTKTKKTWEYCQIEKC